MSSQPNTTTVPFSISHTQTPIRLLELPPAVLSLLTSPDPPVLKIKAAPASDKATRTPSTVSDHAILCTTDKIYSLRQVHSSNTTYLVQPSATVGMTAISTVTSYLELLPINPDPKSLLQPLLLPYPSAGRTGQSRQQLLNDLPVSDAAFCAAWTELCAFERDGAAYTPSVEVVLKTLKEAVTSAAAEGMKLSAPFSVPALVRAIDDPEVPEGLVESVVAQICDSTADGWVLNPERCVRTVGRWVLQEWHEGEKGADMLYIAFMSKWMAVVPDVCAGLCKLEVLKDCHKLPTPNTIVFVPEGVHEKEEGAAARHVLPAKNKWHEKFRKKA